MKAIELTNIKKTYVSKTGTTEALKDITFSIEEGEIFGLLGPNGAGKSTLINILGGVVKKSSGKALVKEIDIDVDHVAAKKKIGIVPQEIGFDAFTPIENSLRYEFGYYGMPVDEAHLTQVLKDLSLEDKRKQIPRMLSGGMKRRFMIARAMMHRPDVLILDEPTAGVDVELRHEMYDLIRELNAKGVTIILTTHYLEEVELLCNRVAIIHKGELIALDEKEDLKNRFQSTRQISLALTKQLDIIPTEFESFSPEWNNEELLLTFQENEYKQVLETIAKQDLPIAHFSVIEPSLEDVFVSLTEN